MRRFGRSVTIIQRGKQLAEGKQRHCIRITNDFGAGELTCIGPTHVGQFDACNSQLLTIAVRAKEWARNREDDVAKQ